jgi:hypothetical protein
VPVARPPGTGRQYGWGTGQLERGEQQQEVAGLPGMPAGSVRSQYRESANVEIKMVRLLAAGPFDLWTKNSGDP